MRVRVSSDNVYVVYYMVCSETLEDVCVVSARRYIKIEKPSVKSFIESIYYSRVYYYVTTENREEKKSRYTKLLRSVRFFL